MLHRMPSSKPFLSGPTRLPKLPKGTLVLDAADATRAALFDFLDGAQSGWGERELAEWLDGAYAHATALAPRVAGKRRTRMSPSGESPADYIARVRAEVIDLMTDTAASWVHAEVAQQISESGFVLRVQDELTAEGHVPIDVADMPLFERVGALFVADHLTRPNDYAAHLLICDRCDAISFDWAPAHRTGCTPARECLTTTSGVRIWADCLPPKMSGSRG